MIIFTIIIATIIMSITVKIMITLTIITINIMIIIIMINIKIIIMIIIIITIIIRITIIITITIIIMIITTTTITTTSLFRRVLKDRKIVPPNWWNSLIYLFLSSAKMKLEWLGLIYWGSIGDLEVIFDVFGYSSNFEDHSSNLEDNIEK